MTKYWLEVYVGVFVMLGLLAVGILTVRLGDVRLFKKSYTLYAYFTSVAGVREGSPVQVYGIEVGKVTSLKIDVERQEAVIGMNINEHIRIYDDGSATIRTQGLIGEKYVAIYPGGTGNPLKPGGIIAETTTPPDIDDLLGKYIFGQAQAK